MLMCELAIAMQRLCELIMQNSLLTLVGAIWHRALEDEGLFRSPRIYVSRTFQFMESLFFFGPSSHNTPTVYEVSGVPLLAKVTGSR